MGQLSANLLAAFRSGAAPQWLVEIGFPAETLRFSLGGYSALGVGHYEDRVLNISTINYAVSERGGTPPALEVTLDLDDGDGLLAQIIEGPDANEVRGSSVVIYEAAPTVEQTDWLTAFTGIIARIDYPEPRRARITARVDDIQFTREMLRPWRITRANWPQAKAEHIGKVGILAYGEHSAANHQTGPGMVKTLCVDTQQFRYGPFIGKPKAIDKVYVDDVEVGSGWSTEALTRGGRSWTVVKFTTDQGDAEVTVDMRGVESVGDGSGTLLTNKADQHAHLLSNFCFGAWTSGSWLSTSSRIDSSLTGTIADFLDARSAEGSLCISDITTPQALIGALCDQESLYVRWTALGTLAFGIDGLFRSAYAAATADWFDFETAPLQITNEDIDTTSGIQVEHVPSNSQGTFLSSFSVDDLGAFETAPDSLQLTTSAAK